MSARGRDVPVALAAGLAVALALWCVVRAPADTEIFVPVHRLACRYPMSSLNTFEGGCDAYLLDFGLFRYHRAYDYTGAASSLLYWPLWETWKSPYSFYALIPLSYFPFAYLFIPDTGPIRIAFLSVPALVLLVRGTFRDPRRSRQVLFGALAAAPVLVCIEDKPFYLFVAPTILVCAIAFGASAGGRDGPVNLRSVAGQRTTALLTFGVIVTIGLGVLFLAGHSDGVTCLSYLRLRMGSMESQGMVGTGKLLLSYTSLPTTFGRRMFGWDRPLMLVSTLCLIPSSVRWNAVMKYAALSTPLTIVILMWHFPPPLTLERDQVFAYLSRPDVASTHVVSTSDLYDQQGVYGDRSQIVTSADPLNPSARADAGALMALARMVSRDLPYVCRTCTRPEVQAAFAGSAINEVELGVRWWKLFDVRQGS